MVDSKRNFISKEVLVALCAKQIFVSKTTRTDIRAVVYHDHLASIVIFLAMFAKTIMFVETTFANVNALTVVIDNVPRFRAIIFAILTELATVMLAILAEKFGGNFTRAGNAKTICSNIEKFKVMGVAKSGCGQSAYPPKPLPQGM